MRCRLRAWRRAGATIYTLIDSLLGFVQCHRDNWSSLRRNNLRERLIPRQPGFLLQESLHLAL
jgi:hypothetical protein